MTDDFDSTHSLLNIFLKYVDLIVRNILEAFTFISSSNLNVTSQNFSSLKNSISDSIGISEIIFHSDKSLLSSSVLGVTRTITSILTVDRSSLEKILLIL